MKKNLNLFVYVAGCSGSFPAPSGYRPIWDPSAPRLIRRESFDRKEYGGRTTCLLIRHGDTFLIIDHGLGIDPAADLLLQIMEAEGRTTALVYVFMTHFHMDHIQGTPQSPLFFRNGITLRYFSPNLAPYRSGSGEDFFSMKNVIAAYSRPTYFPVPLEKCPAIQEHHIFTIGDILAIDDINVQTMSAVHPGGCCMYRFRLPSAAGDVVIMTDHEPKQEPDPFLVKFLSGSHIVFADMQYDAAEYAGTKAIGRVKLPRKGWGHSTPELLFPTLLACNPHPKMVRIVHHDPKKSDMELRDFEGYSIDLLAQAADGPPPFDYALAKESDTYLL